MIFKSDIKTIRCKGNRFELVKDGFRDWPCEHDNKCIIRSFQIVTVKIIVIRNTIRRMFQTSL
jgi:hypothetical protein